MTGDAHRLRNSKSIPHISRDHCSEQLSSGGWTMKTSLLLAIATLIPGVFLMQASGGSAVAVIDFERAVSEAPGGKDAITKLSNFQKEQLTALETKQREADDLENRLRVQASVLTEVRRTELTRDLQAARTT